MIELINLQCREVLTCSMFEVAITKHAYTLIFLANKNDNFPFENFDISLFLANNINCV